MRIAHPFFRYLAATAVVVTATAATAVIGTHQAATAVAQENEDQDDPANVTAAETVIVAHNSYLRIFLR